MAFPAEARRVRDDSLPPPTRLLALKRCISAYAPFGYHATLKLLTDLHGPLTEPSALLAALRTLESSRRSWRRSLLALGRHRRAIRRLGRRPARATLRRREAELIGGYSWPGGLMPGRRRARQQWRDHQVETPFLVSQGVLAPGECRVERVRLGRDHYRMERRRDNAAVALALAVCVPLLAVIVTGGVLLIKPLELSEAEFVTGFTVVTVPLFYLYDVLRWLFERWLERRAAVR
ncbi:hypothetical protein [Catellatospora bangladeshensis]|uniref:Uncharacterized protein n=1 Tax=Catellatospora bangladeshensis TaxID=310355 RepID=A0A8J3JJ67_9ACTN|nr:hypothetical protein [Catellatospora bangladeshensis]GIF85742.1 hypothetical protein Cba03nite_70910 [Catellatospora bangladeshensis]